MRIIITGGAGFIGSHIVDDYIKRGHHVAVIDDLSSGFRRNVNQRAIFYRADIRNAKLVERILSKEKPDILNHHAAKASVIASIKNPIETFDVNVLGTVNLLLSFARHGKGAKKFIFASTGGAMYGTPRKLPVSEKTPPKPLSPYGLSKLQGEEAVVFYGRSFNFPYTIFRYANVYGPRQNPHGEAGVIAIFSEKMRNGERPIIFGNGNKTRDYIYVTDIAKANMLALSRGENEVFNLGTGMETSDREVFDTVALALKFSGAPIFKKSRPGEVKRISLDARRAQRILLWKAKIPFKKGVNLASS